MKIGIFAGATSVRLKNIFTEISRYSTGKHEIKISICCENINLNLLVGWLVVLGFNATLTAKVISWRSVTHYVFPDCLTPVLTQLFFPKPLTTFLTCFCRGERRKYAGKKSRLNRGSNSQPPAHESVTLTTEPPDGAI